MDKNKKELIILILLLFIGANYAVYNYYLLPLQNKLVLTKQKYSQAVSSGNESSTKQNKLKQLKQTQEKLKNDSASLETMTVKDIDTPQLVYDFYASCKKYEIKGDDLIFKLADASSTNNASSSGTSSDTSSSGTSGNSNSNNNSNTSNNTSSTNKSAATDFLKLSIELKVHGGKNKIEEFIRNLDKITSTKMNVISIKLESTKSQTAINSTNSDNSIDGFTPNLPQASVQQETDEVTADIIFNQYIYNKSKTTASSKDYSFYDEKTGFSNFSNMFK